eukprot:CAMPEP_0119300332 /NCGR_PEP_ID=MMETSP1333-20130426/2285_1 /TAXON_ID=418940 /ORGANISM="Scyphosphaera apsteinii, Strain RCC1455" /LENGTH=776 /DNA_ID=CAMNT_0007302057 /DNA_START=287 /DNA_END=2619 /DNA_ORIENTATION=+
MELLTAVLVRKRNTISGQKDVMCCSLGSDALHATSTVADATITARFATAVAATVAATTINVAAAAAAATINTAAATTINAAATAAAAVAAVSAATSAASAAAFFAAAAFATSTITAAAAATEVAFAAPAALRTTSSTNLLNLDAFARVAHWIVRSASPTELSSCAVVPAGAGGQHDLLLLLELREPKTLREYLLPDATTSMLLLLRIVELNDFDVTTGVSLINVNSTHYTIALAEKHRLDIAIVTLPLAPRPGLIASSIVVNGSEVPRHYFIGGMLTHVHGMVTKGLEGVAYDADAHDMYGVVEKYPMRLMRINLLTGVWDEPFNVQARLGTVISDLADIYFEPRRRVLLLLSDKAQTLAQVTLDGKLIGTKKLEEAHNKSGSGIKGFTFTSSAESFILVTSLSELSLYQTAPPPASSISSALPPSLPAALSPPSAQPLLSRIDSSSRRGSAHSRFSKAAISCVEYFRRPGCGWTKHAPCPRMDKGAEESKDVRGAEVELDIVCCCLLGTPPPPPAPPPPIPALPPEPPSLPLPPSIFHGAQAASDAKTVLLAGALASSFVVAVILAVAIFKILKNELQRKRKPLPDYYGTLGCTPAAPTSELRAAYMALAKKLHPDRLILPAGVHANEISGAAVAVSRAAFDDVQAAWAVLKCDRLRAEYDRKLTRCRAKARLFTSKGSTETTLNSPAAARLLTGWLGHSGPKRLTLSSPAPNAELPDLHLLKPTHPLVALVLSGFAHASSSSSHPPRATNSHPSSRTTSATNLPNQARPNAEAS